MTNTIAQNVAQQYEVYDRAVAYWLHSRLLDTRSKNLIVVFASPERAFAEVAVRLGRKGSGDSVDQQNAVPLPFASLNRIGSPYDQKRDNNARLRRQGWQPGDQISYTLPWPVPVSPTYELTVWTRTLLDQDAIGDQTMFEFGPSMSRLLDIEFPEPIGRIACLMRLTDDKRLPVINGSDKQVVMQRVQTFTVAGWLWRPAEEHHIVEQVKTDLVDSNTEELLGTVTVPTNDEEY